MPQPGFAALFDFAGITLGILIALLLVTSKRGNQAANRWLAAYVACLAMLSVGDLLEDSRWVLEYPHLGHVTDWLIFLVGPCLWMYVRRLTMHDRPTVRRWLLHCIPAFLCLLLLLPFYALPADRKQTILAEELGGREELSIPLLIAAAQLFIYWVASLWTLRRFGTELRARFSSIETRTFGWLKSMLAINLGMWLLWIAGLVLKTSWATWLDMIAVPVGLYFLAFLGLRQPALFVGKIAFVPLPPPEPEQLPAAPAKAARYARSGLDQEKVPAYLAQLEELMQIEKPWLENDLTLAQLAERTGLSPHHLSQLLNEELDVTFFDFVNAQRVKEVQRCLADPAYGTQSILDIGLAAGFNSKAAFNAAFKQHTRTTPSQYRLEQRAP